MDSKLNNYIDWCCQRYLTLRPRSVYEVKTYLQRKLARKSIDIDEQERLIQKTIAQLLDDKRLDDDEFVRWYIAEKNYFKPRGKIRLQHDLAQKGISRELVEKIIHENQTSEVDLIRQLIESKYSMIDFKDQRLIEKLTSRLQRQGFRYGDIKIAIEEMAQKE